MKVSVFGYGRWGSFICWYLDKINVNTLIYGRPSEKFEEFKKTRKSAFVEISKKTIITDSLSEAVDFSDIFVIAVSAQSLREFTKSLKQHDLTNKRVVLCMKGIESDTGKRLSEIIEEELSLPCAIWVGPGHPEDFTRGIPNCMVIDSEDEHFKVELLERFSSDLIRFYYGSDLIGNEIGAASKNVVGIAAGMLDGTGLSALKGALMSRGTREISRLIKAMGGNELSAYGLCHLGDYEATVFSKHSHNRMFGESFVQDKRYDLLAEGVETSVAMMILSKRYNTELPICKAVYSILYEDAEPKAELIKLLNREQKSEFYSKV